MAAPSVESVQSPSRSRRRRASLDDELASLLDTATAGLADFVPSPFHIDVLRVPKSKRKAASDAPRLRLDVIETEEKIIVTADLPGVSRENVNVHIEDEGNVLTVEATRERDEEEGKATVLFRERHFGPVSRQIALPEHVNPEDCEAVFENGTLTLRFGKFDLKPKRRKIELSGSTAPAEGKQKSKEK